MTTSTTRIIVTRGRRHSPYVRIGLSLLAVDAVLALPLVFVFGKYLASL